MQESTLLQQSQNIQDLLLDHFEKNSVTKNATGEKPYTVIVPIKFVCPIERDFH
jgi:hypothetical protein